MNDMQKLEKALQVLLNYQSEGNCCAEHDVLYLAGPTPDRMVEADKAILEECGVRWDKSVDSWYMFT